MFNNAVYFCCVAGVILISQSAWADLNSLTYKKAKEAYEDGNCKVAIALLEQYESEYRTFLRKHAKIKNGIDQAIVYCNKYIYISTHFVGDARGVSKKSAIKRELPSKPSLP